MKILYAFLIVTVLIIGIVLFVTYSKVTPTPPADPPADPPTDPIPPPVTPPVDPIPPPVTQPGLPTGITNGINVTSAGQLNYLIEGNKRRPYPNSDIFLSWGPPAVAIIDYADLVKIPLGNALAYKKVNGLPVGFIANDIVQHNGVVYKIDSGKLRKFPSQAIYSTWGAPSFKLMNASAFATLPLGADMGPLMVDGLPGNVQNGQNVRNSGNMGIYAIVNSTARWYPTALIYQSYGSPRFVELDAAVFALIPMGPDMPDNTPIPVTPAATWTILAIGGETINLAKRTNVRYVGNARMVDKQILGNIRCTPWNFGLTDPFLGSTGTCSVMSGDLATSRKLTTYPTGWKIVNGQFVPGPAQANDSTIDFSLQTQGITNGSIVQADMGTGVSGVWFLEDNRRREYPNCNNVVECANTALNRKTIPLTSLFGITEGAPLK